MYVEIFDTSKLPFELYPSMKKPMTIKVDNKITTMSGRHGAIIYYNKKDTVRDFFVNTNVIEKELASYDFDGTENTAKSNAATYNTNGRLVSTWFSV